VVLHDVAHGARLFVEAPSPLDAEVLRHRDLHALHVQTVPQRLEEAVGETEVDQIVDRRLSQVVVDAEDRLLVERLMQDPVQLASRCEVAAERLLQHDAAALGTTRTRETADHDLERARGNREIEGGMARRAERRPDRGERREVCIVSADVREPLRELLERGLIDATAVGLDALARALMDAKRIARLAPHRHHRRVQPPALHHLVQRGKDLLEREVAGGSEDHQRIGRACAMSFSSLARCTWFLADDRRTRSAAREQLRSRTWSRRATEPRVRARP
jgi:hypothetical protein